MANPLGKTDDRWKKGMKSPNPTGRSLPERLAARTISEALRNMIEPDEFGRALLSIFAGQDPFAEERKDGDGSPVPGAAAVPLDWTHRMQAAKMFAEYAYGKPLQGVVVQAEIDSRHTFADQQRGRINVRDLDAGARAALEAGLRKALGAPSSEGSATPILDAASTERRGGSR